MHGIAMLRHVHKCQIRMAKELEGECLFQTHLDRSFGSTGWEAFFQVQDRTWPRGGHLPGLKKSPHPLGGACPSRVALEMDIHR